MPCNRCMTSFNVFRKEHGCSKCGFAFCAKCLTHKATIQALSSKPLPVCPKCYDELTKQPVRHQPPPVSKASPSASRSEEDIHPDQRWWPPEDLPPPSMRHQTTPTGSRSNAAVIPQEKNYVAEFSDPMTADIAERLQRLKADRRGETAAAPPSQSDIETRLANLRGVDVQDVQYPRKMFEQSAPQPKQTPHDLIAQAKDETSLDTKWDPAHDVARRLAHLRDEEYDPSTSARNDDVNPYDYLNKMSTSATDDDRSKEADDSVLKNAAEVDELVKRAQRETHADAQAALAELQNDAQVKDALAKIRQQTHQESMKDDDIARELAEQWDREDRGDNSDDESDKELKEIAERIIKEAELEDAAEKESSPSPKQRRKERPSTPIVDDDDDDEDPWCTICALDATIQCRDCDGELYCKRCFKETHETAELRNHRTKPFKPYGHYQL